MIRTVCTVCRDKRSVSGFGTSFRSSDALKNDISHRTDIEISESFDCLLLLLHPLQPLAASPAYRADFRLERVNRSEVIDDPRSGDIRFVVGKKV